MPLHLHIAHQFERYPHPGAVLIHRHDYEKVEHWHYLDAWDSNADDYDNSDCMTFAPGEALE